MWKKITQLTLLPGDDKEPEGLSDRLHYWINKKIDSFHRLMSVLSPQDIKDHPKREEILELHAMHSHPDLADFFTDAGPEKGLVLVDPSPRGRALLRAYHEDSDIHDPSAEVPLILAHRHEGVQSSSGQRIHREFGNISALVSHLRQKLNQTIPDESQ